MSKRTTAFIAAAIMALSLAACGETSGESKSDKSAVNSTAETTAAADNAEEDSAAETTTTTTTAESAAESAETSSAEEATSVAGMSMTLPEIDTFFSDIDGKTLDELKAYMDEKFPNTQYEESINAYMIGGEQVDNYYWHFPEGLDIEGEKFDYIGVSYLSNKLDNASFAKQEGNEINKAIGKPDSEYNLENKAREYGYEQIFDNDIQQFYRQMNCGRVFIDTLNETGTLSITHSYYQQEIDSNE
ncbi:hypothetical protein [Ruminococcus sp. 210702-SL.1.03]|uniref:hypothetical protein n=1 Tax=Ruminococcus sp. 210702-SL.1.03 TaxID=2883233 RepID=UPI001D08CD37|nr:hypothetical protein [Ruminococcus sp. 210702-SL.1.03]MCB6615370.1 hypothetical protein [Ruminococcus sp. 210702-SL.1.03]